MRFFSKIAMIGNACFILAVLLRYLNIHGHERASADTLALHPLESTIVILGYGAVFINAGFLVAFLFVRRHKPVPLWTVRGCLLCMLVQVCYFILL